MECPFILLTERRQQVLELLAQNMEMKQIARKMYLSYDTVVSHARAVRNYFDATTNQAAVARARAWGFVGPEGSPVGSGPLFVRQQVA